MFPNLKVQIFRQCSHQNKLAKSVGIDETLLSKIIHGYRTPTSDQRRAIADYLGADEKWLFESFEATARVDTPESAKVAESRKAAEHGDL